MISIKKSKAEIAAEAIAEEAKEYNKKRKAYLESQPPEPASKLAEETHREFVYMRGMMAGAELLGIVSSLLWNETGDYIVAVGANGITVKVH